MAVGLLPRYIRVWHERYPNVGIRLHEFRHRSLLEDAVEQGVADFAIGPLPVRAWDGPLREIAWEEFVIVVPPTDPLAGRSSIRLEELADREWVLYHQDHGLAGILEETCRRAGFSPRGSVRTSQAEGAARLASAGLGPALVPDNIVLPGIEGSVLRLKPRLIRDVAAYARTEWSPTAAAFIDMLGSEQRPRPRPRDAVAIRPVGTMASVRRLLPIAPARPVPLSACGGGSARSTLAAAEFAGASGRTVATGKTASFTLSISAMIAGAAVRSSETGSVSFTDRRAHFYKLVPGGGLPQEIVLDGPFAYTNANVDAALKDPSVKPWTKLDTRRVPAPISRVIPTSSRMSAWSPTSRTACCRAKRIGARRSRAAQDALPRPRRSGARRRKGAGRRSRRACAPPCATTISRSRSPRTSGSTAPVACAACSSAIARPAAGRSSSTDGSRTSA